MQMTLYKKYTYFLPSKRWVSADPQFFAQWAREGVNRSGAWGLKDQFRSKLSTSENWGLMRDEKALMSARQPWSLQPEHILVRRIPSCIFLHSALFYRRSTKNKLVINFFIFFCNSWYEYLFEFQLGTYIWGARASRLKAKE